MNRLWKIIFLGGLGVIASGISMALNTGVTETSEGELVLAYEKSYWPSYDPYESGMIWALDNRRLAFTNSKYDLIVGDVDSGTERIIGEGVVSHGSREMAWSPDGRTLAVRQIGRISGIRLFDVETGTEINRLERDATGKLAGEHFARGAITFTADGKHIWIANNTASALPARGPYKLMQKLSVPDLRVVDHITVELPAPAAWTHFRAASFITRQERLLVTFLVASYVQSANGKSGSAEASEYAYALNVEAKSEYFPHFSIEEEKRTGFRRLAQDIILFDLSDFALLRYSGMRLEGPNELNAHKNLQYDRQFEIYQTRPPSKIVSFGGLQNLESNGIVSPEGGMIGDASLSQGDKYLLAYWSIFDLGKGGLAVFDPLTGKLLQRITFNRRTWLLALSPDQSRAATAISGSTEIRIYRVRTETGDRR